MNIALIGADGQLGTDVHKNLLKNGFTVTGLTRADIDIAERDSVNTALRGLSKTGLIINTAAFHHVEKCETDPVSSFRVNGAGAANLAYFCRDAGVPLMHISTDYVFDGTKRSPYVESALPNPLNVYAHSKLTGEYFIRSIMDHFFILRLSGIYGSSICMEKGYNFVDKIIKLGEERGEVKVVDDEVLTPTFTEEIAAQISRMIIGKARYGTYHVSAEGECSWYEFTKEIFRIKNNGVKVNKAAPGEFSGGVKRPAYSVLENQHLKSQNLNIMTHWTKGLRKYIESYR